MNIDLLFQIAGVGILIFAVNQVLQRRGVRISPCWPPWRGWLW